ncbi:MAG: hypothetical protein MZU97_24205 [Bacillus subtilis]|nr:hypothetical protein [Bacillus subtilis]
MLGERIDQPVAQNDVLHRHVAHLDAVANSCADDDRALGVIDSTPPATTRSAAAGLDFRTSRS